MLLPLKESTLLKEKYNFPKSTSAVLERQLLWRVSEAGGIKHSCYNIKLKSDTNRSWF